MSIIKIIRNHYAKKKHSYFFNNIRRLQSEMKIQKGLTNGKNYIEPGSMGKFFQIQ